MNFYKLSVQIRETKTWLGFLFAYQVGYAFISKTKEPIFVPYSDLSSEKSFNIEIWENKKVHIQQPALTFYQ